MHHHRHGHGHGHWHGVIEGASAVRYDRVVSRWVLPPLYRAVVTDAAAVAPPGGAVLDVGTGPGRLLLALARRRPDLALVGVDPSPDMVALARQHLPSSPADRAQVQVAPAEDLPFPDGSFDVVVSTLSAHHWSDPVAGLAQQARVLRPGGQLRVYDLRRPVAALVECADAAGLRVVPDATTSLGRVARLLLTALVAIKPASSAADPRAAQEPSS